MKDQALDEIEVIAEWEDVGFFSKGNEFGSSLTYFSEDVIEFIRGHPKEVSDEEFTYSLSAEGDKLVKQRKNPRGNDLDTVRVTRVRPEKKKLPVTNNNVTKKNLPTIEFTSIRHELDKGDPKVKKTGN